MKDLSLHSMTNLLTLPYRRGAEILEIPLGEDSEGWTSVADYDFSDYRRRYQSEPPEPKYIFFPLRQTGQDALQIEVEYAIEGATQTTSIALDPNTFAQTSQLVPLPTAAAANLRLLRLRQLPVPLSGTGRDNWRIVALLGNIAKLLWVLGREKDLIQQHLQDVQQQRLRTFAYRFSLDRLGTDLGVPRFPPSPYSFDTATLALYHLDESSSETEPVVDEMARLRSRFGLSGHPGANNGAIPVVGKFGGGLRFPGSVEIAHHETFDLPSTRSFTVEGFLKLDPVAEGTLQVVMAKGQHNASGELVDAGWSLQLIDVRGFSHNLSWTVRDRDRQFTLFADLNLADEQFHHFAATLDRTQQRLRLFVDGIERANTAISDLADVTNGEPILWGRSHVGHQFFGVLDEVRFSSVARSQFHPVLGESDTAYRQRLGLFERWFLPTPQNLLDNLNRLVRVLQLQSGSFVTLENPFEIEETDRPILHASQLVRLLPDRINAGQSIAVDGRFNLKEASVSGVAAEETDFRDIYLLRHDRARVNYGSQDNQRRMQRGTQLALSALLALLARDSVSGNLILDKSFDPDDSGLHSVGRALLLRHETLPPQTLAVYAHRANFDYVRNTGTQVYASVAPQEKLEIVVEALTEEAIDLQLAPEPLPRQGRIQWTLIPCGTGKGRLVAHPDDPASSTPVPQRPRLRLLTEATGEITVRVEYTLERRTVTGTQTLQLGAAAAFPEEPQAVSIVRVEDGELLPLPEEMTVGEAILVQGNFAEPPEAGDYNWTVDPVGKGRGKLDFAGRSQVTFTPLEPGWLRLNLSYFPDAEEGTLPYRFAVKLRSDFDVPETVIPKDRYDLLMNLLNYFHPIGVEVITTNIRDRVVELEANPLGVFPSYTYPYFRN